MIIFEYTFVIDKGKEEEYLKWSAETGASYWLKQQGVKEMRSYTAKGTNKRKVIIEMESFEAWGKAIGKPEMDKITKEFSKFIHGLNWTIWEEAGRFSP